MQRFRRIWFGYLYLSTLLDSRYRGVCRKRSKRRSWHHRLLPQGGRALGEVTKFLVYNARKRQEGGDRAETYFERTECVAGVQDMRFQQLMPDVLNWLGVKHIDILVSMSNMKYDAIVSQGITVGERLAIPDEQIPDDAR